MNRIARTALTRRAALAVALSGATLLAGVVPSALAGGMPFVSKIRLTDRFPAFHGKVKSESSACVANRKIRLFKQKRGADAVLGKTRTGADGKWQILMDPTSGVFYAKVNQSADEATGISCLPDTSKKVVID